MTEYKANSHKVREEQKQEIVERKKIEPIAKAKTKKKSEIKKFTDVFIAEDVTSVKNYIVNDVLIPAAKKAISDIVTNGIDMILYGEARGKDRRSSSGGSRVSYTKYYDRDRDRDRDRDYDRNRTRRSVYDYDDIILDTRGEAEDVLNRMDDLIDAYGMVSVADLYDLVGVQGNYTDNKYGWTNLRNAEVRRTRDGYLIKLPKALPFD